MKNPKKSSAKASSASKRTQKSWETRNAMKKEIANEILRLSDENHKLKDEKSHLAAQLFDFKNKPTMDMCEQPKVITAESLRIDLNNLKLNKERSLNDFNQKIAAKEAEIGDFIKKRKAEIETLS